MSLDNPSAAIGNTNAITGSIVMFETLNHSRNISEWHAVEPDGDCRGRLNRRAFRVTHNLNDDPLFSIGSLLEAAEAAAKRPSDLYFDAGDVSITDKWGNIPIPNRSVKEVIDRIENAGAWIVIKHVDADPRYGRILADWASFARQLAGEEVARDLINPELIAFITSPKRVTPFHFDEEVNFLVQISGSKEVWVCDPLDRSIISEDEIERYYAGNVTAGVFRPDVEQRADHFILAPGDGVHIPCHGAHWVRNGSEISISLSFNFEMPRWKHANVYRANHYLRRFGITPRQPGQSPFIDRAKSAAIDAAKAAHSVKKFVTLGGHERLGRN